MLNKRVLFAKSHSNGNAFNITSFVLQWAEFMRPPKAHSILTDWLQHWTNLDYCWLRQRKRQLILFWYLNWKHTVWLLSCIETKLKWHWLSEIYFERFIHSLKIVQYSPSWRTKCAMEWMEKRNNCILLSSSMMQKTILRSIYCIWIDLLEQFNSIGLYRISI